MNRALLLAAAALAVSGCAAAGGVPKTSETPRRDLAGRPQTGSAAPGPAGTSSAASATPGSSTAPAASSPGSSPAPTTSAGGTPAGRPAAPFHDFTSLTDPAGDAGPGAPAYVDLRAVTLADNGTSLQVTVVVNGAIPRTTDPADTVGIGVDLYPPGTGRESDYQLFADGEPDGWFAYLDTPRGFVRYPGSFTNTGDRLVFTVPLSAVGSPHRGRVSAFADWSRKASGVTGNKSSNDFTPTLGTTSYSR